MSSFAAAIVFIVLYAILTLWLLFKLIKHPSRVFMALLLFTFLRIIAFIMRAAFVRSNNPGSRLRLFRADQIFFEVGYFALLYAAYHLLLKLEKLHQSRTYGSRNPVVGNNVTGNTLTGTTAANTGTRRGDGSMNRALRWIFRFLTLVAVILGIAGYSKLREDGTTSSKYNALRKASTILFLVLTAWLFFSILNYIRRKRSYGQSSADINHRTTGARHDLPIITLISLLLLIRQSFATATMMSSRFNKRFNDRLWYPLVALPEILAVLLFLVPGLVPRRRDTREGPFETDKTVHRTGHPSVQPVV